MGENNGDVEWFQNGPTTHLTDDGKAAMCGAGAIPPHVDTHSIDDIGDLNVCGRCAAISASTPE